MPSGTHRKGQELESKTKIAIDAAIPQSKDFDSFCSSWRRGAMKSNRASLFHSAPPDRNASPAARPWGGLHRGTDHPANQGHCHRPRAAQKKRRGNLPADRLGGQYQGPAVGGGYARWAKRINWKQAANSLNFITEHQIDSYEGLGKQAGRDQRGGRRGGLRP